MDSRMTSKDGRGAARVRAGERGIALLMVITVLVTLVLIAVPFAISMRQGRERTTSELAKGRATFEATLLIEAMKHYLGNTHPMLEEERWIAGERTVTSDPSVDSLEEITIGESFRDVLQDAWAHAMESDRVREGDPRLLAHLQALDATGLGLLNDDRGSIWTGVASDANGCVNANGASPYLIGNLLGSALLTDELDPAATDIDVDHLVGSPQRRVPTFPKDGGYIRIGNEVIRYRTFDGGTFRGCERGSLPETPLKDNGVADTHPKGSPVIDYVAYKIATHLIAARPGFLTPFMNLEDLRSIAGWGGGPGLTADRLDRIRDRLTVWSRRETASGWLSSQVVVNQLPVSADPTSPDEVEVRDQFNPTGTTAFMNAGSIVRVTDGVRTAYQAVAHVGDMSWGQLDKVVTLAGRVDAAFKDETVIFEGGETKIAALAPHPININTAPREVLYACMANLHLRGADTPENIVTPDVAWSLAELIVEERARPLSIDVDNNRREMGPFRHIEDFGRFLERLEEQGILSQMQRAALYINAVNTHDYLLVFGTAPWCYRTLDVYHLESRVAVNSRGGEQMATASRREVVEIGSDGKTSWVLDSQVDFEERLSMGHGAKWMATHPWGVNFRNEATAHIQPALRAQKAFGFDVYPNPARSDMTNERGEVRLEPARVKFRLPGAMVRNHFDSSLFTEGWRTDFSGAYTRGVRGALIPEDGVSADAFSMSFWWNSYSDANWTAFDCGMEQFQNRYAIFVTEGQEGPELVFRVCAAPLEKRGAEIFVPLERIGFAPGTWYNIHVSCGGEDPSLMELFVDGVAVGQRRGVTWLSGGVTEEQAEIQVEDTIGFADVGALLIGGEVVEYETRTSDGFSDCLRGARGTGSAAWPSGTPVRDLGYSTTIVIDAMPGGARIPDSLGYWTAARLEVPFGDADLIVETSSDANAMPPVVFEFHGVASDTASFEAQLIPLWDDCSVEEMGEAFQTKGIALMGCRRATNSLIPNPDQSDDGVWLHGWEVVYYERDDVTSSTVRIVRRNIESWNRPAWPREAADGDVGHLLSFWAVDQNMSPPVPMRDEVPAFLVPISVIASASATGEDYLDPSAQADQEILARYYNNSSSDTKPYRPAYVALGVPSGDGGEPEDVEIIRYDRIERDLAAPEILFVRDRGLQVLVDHFFEKNDQGDLDTPVDDGEEEEEGLGEDDPEGVPPEDRPEDVTPPKDVEIPEEDPETDSSGGGDNERGEEEIEYTEEVILALDELPDAKNWGAFVSDYYGVQDWDSTSDIARFIREQFRGILPGRDGEYRDWRHEPGVGSERNDLLMPLFRVAWWGRPCGRNDRITFVSANRDEPIREAARIRWGAPRNTGMRGYVALDDVITRRFAADEEGAEYYRPDLRGRCRVLKFPCGELPDELPNEMEFARSTVSNSEVVTALLDELNIWAHPIGATLHLLVENDDSETVQGLQASDTDLRLYARHFGRPPDNQGFDEDCGILDLDGELIVWREARWEQETTDSGFQYWVLSLDRCERGVLGTQPRFHPSGAFGRMVPHFPVSWLDGRANRDAASLPMGRTRGWPREGLVRITDGAQAELVHYTRLGEDSLQLPESTDVDEKKRGRGLLRGRFGTDVIDHDSEALVFWQPFRYWDRYMARRTEDNQSFAGVHDHPQGAYLELGKRVRAGYWHRVMWGEGPFEGMGNARGGSSGGESTGLLDVVVLGRFSPNVPWDSDRIVDLRTQANFAYSGSSQDGRPRDSLYVMDDPNAENLLGLEAETAEFRVFLVFRPGAFLPQDLVTDNSAFGDLVFENSWKLSPSLLSFTVEYTSRTSTLNRSLGD